MELIGNIERRVAEWCKPLPRLPKFVRVWLVDNSWWMTIVLAAAGIVGALGSFSALLSNVSTLGSPVVGYYASSTFLVWATVRSIIALALSATMATCLVFAVTPLRERQKRGWTLLFTALLVSAVMLVVNAVMTLNALGFITELIFGGFFLAVIGYGVIEIRNDFAHVETSKGAKKQR